MKTITSGDLPRYLDDVLDVVVRGDRYQVKRDGESVAVLVSVADLAGLDKARGRLVTMGRLDDEPETR